MSIVRSLKTTLSDSCNNKCIQIIITGIKCSYHVYASLVKNHAVSIYVYIVGWLREIIVHFVIKAPYSQEVYLLI